MMSEAVQEPGPRQPSWTLLFDEPFTVEMQQEAWARSQPDHPLYDSRKTPIEVGLTILKERKYSHLDVDLLNQPANPRKDSQ